MATTTNLRLPALHGCGCESCDLCVAEREAVLSCLLAQVRAVEARTERQRAIIMDAEEGRFSGELPVY